MIYDKRLNDMIKEMNYSGIQDIYTPIDTIEETTNFSFLNNINGAKEICILFNVEFFQYFIKQDYIKNNGIKLVFGYDCEIKKNIAIELSTDNKYSNVEAIDLTKFSETKDIKEFNRIMAGRKFDVVFSNPPYNKNLDLKILQVLFTCSNKIIFIHPAGFLFDKKFDCNLYNDIRNTNYLNYVNFFFGNKLFNIQLFLPMCISVWDTSKYDNICSIEDNALWNEKYNIMINDISFHKIDMYTQLKQFKDILNKYTSIIEYKVTKPKSDYNIFISPIKGTKPEAAKTNDFGHLSYDLFTIVTKDISKSIVDINFRFKDTFSDSQSFLWSFNTINERDNCIQYFKTKVCRFLLSFRKTGQNLSSTMDLIPWLDFTRSWNDKDLCKEFNISKELWKYIDKFIPDYYDDYESGFEHHTCKTITSKVYDKPSQEMIDFCGEAIIEELNNKKYEYHWGQHFKQNPNVEPNGTAVYFKKNGKTYWIQKSINKHCKEGSKYYNRVGYELYEALDKNE